MPTINLGSIFESGGKTLISGGSSGLDVESIVNSLVEAKRLPAVQLESNIEKNQTKLDTLGTLSTLLESYREAANFLRNPPGVGNAADSVFAYRSISLTTNTGVAAETYLTATAEAGTNISNFDITVDQIATRQTRVSNVFALADLDTQAVDGGGPFNAGVLQLGPGLEPITLNSGDTLRDVLTNVNAAKGASGVEMSAIEVTPGNFQIIFKATQTGTDQNFDFTANNPGIFNPGFQSETDAVDAMMTVDGAQVTRQTNTINDVVDGVTFSLSQVTPGGTAVNASVNPDTEIAKEAIMNLVDVYNQFRVFAAEQTETNDDGEVVDSAVLQRSAALRTLVNGIGSEVAKAIGGLGDGFNELADIGITLDDYEGDEETPFVRNILQVDEAVLGNALASNFDDVRKIFEFDYTADDPNMVVFSRTNALNTNQISYNIDQTNGIYEATFDDGSGPQTVALEMSPLGGGGVSLTGPDGTAIAGLVVLYTDPGDATVNMDVTQGISDRFFNLMQNALDEDEGLVATEISSLNDRNARIEKDIEQIDEMIESYRESLLERFSALEAAISSVNSILQLLDAQAEARASN